jgi:hypothetical protein
VQPKIETSKKGPIGTLNKKNTDLEFCKTVVDLIKLLAAR